MGLVMQFICLVLILCSIASSLVIQGSGEDGTSPSPSTFSATPPIGSLLHPPHALPPLKSVPGPEIIKAQVPSLPPSTPAVLPPLTSNAPPVTFQVPPSLPPSGPQEKPPQTKNPILAPQDPVPAGPPSVKSPQNAPHVHPPVPENKTPPPVQSAPPPREMLQSPPSVRPIVPEVSPPQNAPHVRPPMPENKAPPPVQSAPPPREMLQSPPPVRPIVPEVSPPSILPVPVSAPPRNSLPIQPKFPKVLSPNLPEPDLSPVSAPPPSIHTKTGPTPTSSPPISVPRAISPVKKPDLSSVSAPPPPPSIHTKTGPTPTFSPPISVPKAISPVKKPDLSPVSAPPPSIHTKTGPTPTSSPPISVPKAISPVKTPPLYKAPQQSINAPPPRPIIKSPPNKDYHPPASLPSTSINRHHNATKNITASAPLYYTVPPPPTQQGSLIPPTPLYPPKLNPDNKHRHLMPPPLNSEHPLFSGPTPSPSSPPIPVTVPFPFPKISPPRSSPKIPKMPLLTPFHSLPPPPPNEDCTSITCTEPLTNTPPGSPCGCVWPMQVGLRLSVALYTFFPLVSELANEIAVGVFMRQSQVRIMGANAASQDLEKTIVLVDLVPLGERIDNTTAYLIYQRFWNKQVLISTSFFGDYEVLYVRYPGLPPSPPSAPSSVDIIGSDPYTGNDNNGVTRKPLGVDVSKRRHKNGVNRGVIAIIVLSASIAVILCCAVAWVFLFKHRDRVCQPDQPPPATIPSSAKLSGAPASMVGSGPISVSLSFGSSIAPYTGSAKTYSSGDIERATDNFNDSRILGEGGFGRVYSGALDDGTKVAVKVLKRDDQQGGREFLAEVEMLSRLHHRNLVKLIGICTEDRSRCLVYELIPNGSVESHLHGIDRDNAPLDWVDRMKIALGAARGLAYLHEDSSPRVIHRDFKSSNILLEHDFTPKVSDFGLARTAFDEKNKHISTRVMGTFGYVAPEYAMTGHLLVKSDVYSYGVVLLELLTGRKPVDMSQPPGQENLVSWARPRLATKEGLESIIDPSLGPDFPIDSIAKVAAIASMCVQPEVSHRPFMGEVVQALKLVCNECDEAKDLGSRTCSQENLSVDFDPQVGPNSGPLPGLAQTRSPMSDYGSPLDVERGHSASDLLSGSLRYGRHEPRSFRRHSSSGPLMTQRSLPLWQRMRRLSGGSVSEHGAFHRLWPGSQ